MVTSTTRLGLEKPDYADAADIAVLNQNFDDIDNAVGLRVVTSTTRPATPWNGQIIFETDTNATLMWDSTGAAWKQIGNAATVCTSATRPASPLNGQIIYETDTRRLLVYSTAAAAWRIPFLNYSVADFTALAALTGMVAGANAYVVEGDVAMVYDGTSWNQHGLATFATSAARDTAYAKASAAYRIQGTQVYQSDTNTYWNYSAIYNSSTNIGGATTAGWYLKENTVIFAGKRTNTAGVSVTSSTYAVATFNTFSTIGGTTNTDTVQLDSLTVPSTFTVRKAGWYRLSGACTMAAWSSLAGTARAIAVNRNNAAYNVFTIFQFSESGVAGPQVVTDTATVLLAAGDVIRFFIFQDSGGAATNSDTNFSIEYLRPASV